MHTSYPIKGYYVFEILQAVILVAHNTLFVVILILVCSVAKNKNGDAVMEKAHHVTSNAEYARWYGSQKNSNMVCGEVIESLNKPTYIGRRIWYVRARYDLGGGTMKIAQLTAHSIKEAPVIPQSGHVSLPTPPTIADISNSGMR